MRVLLAGILFLAGALAQAQGDSRTIPVTIPDETTTIFPQGIRIDPNPGLPGTPQAPLAQAWDFLGNTLNTACRLTSGSSIPVNIGGFTFPFTITRPPAEIEWVCDVAQTWRFLNGLVNNDWLQEARDLVAQWTGDLASVVLHSVAIEAEPTLGMDQWSQKVREFNDALKQGYRVFKKAVYNAVWDSAKADLDRLRQERKGQSPSNGVTLPPHTEAVKKVEDTLEATSPLAIVGAVERAAEKADKAKRETEAGNIKKESNKPIEKTVPTDTGEKISPLEEIQRGINNKKTDYDLNARDITGQPMDNTARRIFREVQQAPDTRTALEGLTKAVLAGAQATLYGNDAIVKALSLAIQQGVLTNRALAFMLEEAGAASASEELALREGIQEIAEETSSSVYGFKLQQKAVMGMVEGLFRDPVYRVAF